MLISVSNTPHLETLIPIAPHPILCLGLWERFLAVCKYWSLENASGRPFWFSDRQLLTKLESGPAYNNYVEENESSHYFQNLLVSELLPGCYANQLGFVPKLPCLIWDLRNHYWFKVAGPSCFKFVMETKPDASIVLIISKIWSNPCNQLKTPFGFPTCSCCEGDTWEPRPLDPLYTALRTGGAERRCDTTDTW